MFLLFLMFQKLYIYYYSLALEVISQFVRTANIYLDALYNGLEFTLTHFFENILEFVRQTSIIATV